MVTEIRAPRAIPSSSSPLPSPERREPAARRFKTFWPTSLRTANEVRRAHVLNISRTGAKIHAQESMDINQALEIAIGGIWFGGLVRWRHGSTFGIAFDDAISEENVQKSLDAP
ncbi:MAG: PilZ domain-containing protein [Sphingomonas sp.]